MAGCIESIDSNCMFLLFLPMTGHKGVFFVFAAIVLFIVVTAGKKAHCFDFKGLQPVQPHGVFSTFSATTNEKGAAALGIDLEQSVDPTFYRITSSVSYSLTDIVEFSASVPFSMKTSEYGFEDPAVGIKARIFEETELRPAIAVLGVISPPSGSEDITTNGRYGGGLILSKKVGPFRTHLNLLYYVPFKESLRSQMGILFGTDYPVAHNLNLLSELYLKRSHLDNSFDYFEGRIGYRFKPLDFLYTTLGIGYEFMKSTPDIRIFLNFTLVHSHPVYKRIYEEEQ
ncbi:MAG: YjbH domain-containing protein [Nitrospirae bacterium YQR-1]